MKISHFIQSPFYNYYNWDHYATFDFPIGKLIQLKGYLFSYMDIWTAYFDIWYVPHRHLFSYMDIRMILFWQSNKLVNHSFTYVTFELPILMIAWK